MPGPKLCMHVALTTLVFPENLGKSYTEILHVEFKRLSTAETVNIFKLNRVGLGLINKEIEKY